jgi:DNA uptake protein ComE-like DNA-binding protein
MQEEIKQIIEQYSESMIERLNRLEQSLDTKLNTLTNSVEHLQKASTQTSQAPVTPKQTRKAVVMEAKTQEAKTQAPAKNIISSGDKFLDFINAATLQDLRNLGTDLYDSNLSAIIKKKKKDGPFKSIAEFEQWVAKNKTFSPILYSKFLAKWKEQESSASDSSNDSVESTTVTVQEEEDSSKPESASDDVAPPVEPVPTTPKKRSSKKNLRGIDKLNQMNQVELAQTLHRLKLSSKLIEAILEQRPFGSFETINIRGLGPKKVQIIQEEFDK